MKSSSATTPEATASANRQAADPDLTALRKVTNLLIAATILLMVFHAATRPWMIAMIAPAAGTIIDTSFSMTSEMIIPGSDATIACQAIRPIWAIEMQPLTSTLMMVDVRPTTDSTFSLNQVRTALLIAPHR